MNPSANTVNVSLITPAQNAKWIELAAREPFRVFFPAATLAGILGVALWPLNLLGFTSFYPGQLHAHIMAFGMFGGFIFGFLGTAMPRMLSARPLRVFETGPLLLLHILMVSEYAIGNLRFGNAAFLTLLGFFLACMALRIPERKDVPPPGFMLVALSLACAGVGAALGLKAVDNESPSLYGNLQPLLSYQGFVLFPI
jgi:uncharacterized protein involved in response to NO